MANPQKYQQRLERFVGSSPSGNSPLKTLLGNLGVEVKTDFEFIDADEFSFPSSDLESDAKTTAAHKDSFIDHACDAISRFKLRVDRSDIEGVWGLNVNDDVRYFVAVAEQSMGKKQADPIRMYIRSISAALAILSDDVRRAGNLLVPSRAAGVAACMITENFVTNALDWNSTQSDSLFRKVINAKDKEPRQFARLQLALILSYATHRMLDISCTNSGDMLDRPRFADMFKGRLLSGPCVLKSDDLKTFGRTTDSDLQGFVQAALPPAAAAPGSSLASSQGQPRVTALIVQPPSASLPLGLSSSSLNATKPAHVAKVPVGNGSPRRVSNQQQKLPLGSSLNLTQPAVLASRTPDPSQPNAQPTSRQNVGAFLGNAPHAAVKSSAPGPTHLPTPEDDENDSELY